MFGEILSSGVPGRLPTSCGSADWNKSGDALESISDLASPAVSLSDFYYQVAGFEFSSLQLFGEHLDGPAVQVDLPALGLDSAVPIFFFEGTADQQAPVELAEQYYEQIRVPHKEFVRLAGGHHFLALNMPDEFHKELLARVQPILATSTR